MLRYPGTPFLNPSIKIFHSENLEWFLLPTQIFFIFVGFSLLLSTFPDQCVWFCSKWISSKENEQSSADDVVWRTDTTDSISIFQLILTYHWCIKFIFLAESTASW